MKKEFTVPEMEILALDILDVITTSDPWEDETPEW